MSDAMFDEIGVVKGKPYKYGDWKQYAVHSDTQIKGFFGKYRWLSNFHKATVEYEGLMYPSTENAFQAAKIVIDERKPFQSCEPYASKKMWKLRTRIDLNAKEWEDRRVHVMTVVTIDKYLRHADLREKLLSTGERYLEESNHWGDNFWGVDIRKGGENQLGKLLMNTRSYFRNHWRKIQLNELVETGEPSEEEIRDYMKENNESFYAARERLREIAYGGKAPEGYQSWGDYWKSI